MNFSNSSIWNNSLLLRYPKDKLKQIENLYFYENNNILVCQNFFEINLSDKALQKIKIEIEKEKKLKFNYINDSKCLDRIKNWTKENNYIYEVIDSWQAPQLILNEDLIYYLKNNKHLQVRKNYNKYQKEKINFQFYNSDKCDVLKLWNDVLTIDFNSWKKDENSDMKSLNREDLQYLPYILLEKEKSSLVVINENDIPLAYSLMFKDFDNTWYAVKWGASNLGRKKYAGFLCLFNHLEYLYNKDKKLCIDFWGRRNRTYDELKNKSVNRKHIIIYKKEI